MRLPPQKQRALALLAVVAGGGAFGAALSGVTGVDATLSAATPASSGTRMVRVADHVQDHRRHGCHRDGRTDL